MYKNRADKENYIVHTAVAALGFDAVWALAIALNKTAVMVQNGNVSETGCEGNTEGDLVPLEQFNYSNGLMGCVIQWNLQNTDFQGTSVSLKSGKKMFTIAKLVVGEKKKKDASSLALYWYLVIEEINLYCLVILCGYR